jgi:hypothetical protein
MNFDLEPDHGRRRTLVTGGTLLAGLLGTQTARADQSASSPGTSSSMSGKGGLPVSQMETILRSQGKLTDGVLTIEQDRNDLDNVVGPGGIPWKPSFQIQNELHFQPIGSGRAIFNGELSLLDRETNPVIDRIVSNGLVFQAFHQHFFDLKPQLWHIHVRGTGTPLTLARAVANVIAATGTPLPQTMPAHPTSPLNANLLGKILGGMAEIGEQGVVHVSVARKEQIILGGVPVESEMGVEHVIAFEPLGNGRTAVAPDFALIASEVDPVMRIMRKYGFTVHCLYNQETAERPQLYFSHQLAVGDAYELARAIRQALEKTNTGFSS